MLTLSPVARRRVLALVSAVAIFVGGIGATRAWDAVRVHQAQHAAWPAMATAINLLLAEVPAAGAAFQQAVGAGLPLPALAAAPPVPDTAEEAETDPVEETDAKAADDTEDTDDGSDPS